MKNKTFKRIIKKTVTLGSRQELIEALLKYSAHQLSTDLAEEKRIFFENLIELLDQVDKAFEDFEKVIEIRDRSLTVNSVEMTAMNNEIREHATQQALILSRLQMTIDLLGQTEIVPQTVGQDDLEKLVETVAQLVKTQKNSVEFQKMLFEEGVKICSVLNFKNLEIQLRNSIEKLIQSKVKLTVYFSGVLFEGKNPIEFYHCNELNQPMDDERISQITDQTTSHFIRIDSPKGSGTLAMIRVESESMKKSMELSVYMTQIAPLVPSIASTVENIRLLKEEKHKQHMETELNTVRLVQNTLLPPPTPVVSTKDLEVSGYYQSATECSGDWWSYFKLIDGRHVILVGDVTGHGTASAMVCAVVKGYCDSFINRANIKISEILNELNSVVYRTAKGGNRVMTMAAVAVDTRTGEGTYANAGHPLPILVQTIDAKITSKNIVSSGPILGVQASAIYNEVKFKFNYGDKIVFYSDGLTEATNKQDMMYGENRLLRFVRSLNNNMTASDLNRAIIQDVQDFSIGESFKDDLTTVVVRNLSQKSVDISPFGGPSVVS